MAQPGRRAGGAGGDQFYVTHCAITDSVLNNPGYTVRAASTTDPDALDDAFQYPPYELPIELWRDPPARDLAPRRLARTKHPDGGVWAVHSAYLEKDTVGRDRCYFSHLLLLDDAGTADVLRSWGADGWATAYPPGEPKKLPRATALPVGTLVGDEALTSFLNDAPGGPTELSLTVCPDRARDDTPGRRDLFAKFLHALLVLAEEEDDARRRLYVHAEPGLLALLLYGAVRLLPPAVTDDLTFSTFEPAQRNLRDYKLAEVVGTYLGTDGRGLDPDLGTTRGIALDTFVPGRSSPELRRGGPPEGVGSLVELAVAGEWALLPAVRAAVGPDPGGLHRAGAALARARTLARVDGGTATVDELMELQADPQGADELRARAAAVWRLIREPALKRPDVLAAFRELVARPEHLDELWKEALQALLSDDFRRWDARWAAARAAAPGEAAKLLDDLVGRKKNEGRLAKLPTDARAKLRQACADVGLFPPRPLLVPNGAGELEPLLRAPPDWAGVTAFVLMGEGARGWLEHVPAAQRDPMRARARAFLQAAPAAALAAYVRAARPYLDTDPRFLTDLLAPYSPESAVLMDKLLASDALEPGDWMKLVAAVGLTQDEWGAFLLEKGRLANLLVGLGGDGIGRDVWAGYLDALTPALLHPHPGAEAVHAWERNAHAHLRAAADRLVKADVRLVQALPPGGVPRLFAANNLVKWVDDPGAIPADSPDEVPHACDAFGVDRGDFVRAAFVKHGFDRLPLPDRADALAPVVALFRACFPADSSFNTARRAAAEAVRLSEAVPEEARGELQVHLILAYVPESHLTALADETRGPHPLDPGAAARLRERLVKPKKAGAKAAKPAPPPVEAPFEDEDAPDDAAPVIAKSRKGKGYKKKPKAKGKGCLGLVLLAATVGVLLARAL